MRSIVSTLNSKGFSQICNSFEEVLDFIHNVKHQDHCILIFQNDDVRDTIAKEFVNSKYSRNMVTACFAHNPTKYNCNHEITYDKLVQKQKFKPEVISDFLSTVLDKPYSPDSTRIVCEDTACLSEAGFFEEHQKYGNNMNKKVINDSTILCCYNSSKLDKEKIDVVLSSRKYVILDEPFSVYEKIN
jgi:hypothetical protein